MIIVIGMDNSGKTTLVKELAEELELTTIKSPGPIPEQEQKDWAIQQIARALYEDKIHERFPLIEELVYGPVLRDKSVFAYNDNYFKLLRAAEPIIIYARPSNEKIFNFGEREQYPGVIEKKEKLLAKFDELVFKLISDGWRVLTYNFEHNTSQELAKALRVYKLINL